MSVVRTWFAGQSLGTCVRLCIYITALRPSYREVAIVRHRRSVSLDAADVISLRQLSEFCHQQHLSPNAGVSSDESTLRAPAQHFCTFEVYGPVIFPATGR